MIDRSSFELSFLGDPSKPETPGSGPGDEALADLDLDLQEVRELVEMLDHHFRDQPRVHVGSDVAVYYEEGNPAASVTPDLFILREDRQRLPGHFKLWESGPSPAAVIEVSTEATREADLGLKRDVYEQLGVEEYFLYDPLGEYLDPPFRGYRLDGRRYRVLAPESDGSVVSRLGLAFRVEDGRLIVVDTTSGTPLMRPADAFDELERLRSDVVRMLGE